MAIFSKGGIFTQSPWVPYVGAKKDVDLGSHNLTTTGNISGNWTGEVIPIAYGGNASTGLINLANDHSVNADNTKVDLSAGTGLVIDNSDPDNPVSTSVSWDAFIGVTPTYLTTRAATYFSIDVNGDLVQRTAPITGTLLRSEIFIGSAVHTNLTTVSSTLTRTKAPIANVALTLGDLADAEGTIQFKGEEVEISANGANLSIDISTGRFFNGGENWAADKASPNVTDYAGATAPFFFMTWQDGSGGFTSGGLVDVITPGRYDDGTGGVGQPNGVISALEFQNILVYLAPASGFIIMQYGQTVYRSIMGAMLARESDRKTSVINPGLAETSFIGFITVRGDATDLTDFTEVDFGDSQEIDTFYDRVTSLGDGLVQDKASDINVVANGTTTTVELQLSGGGDTTVQLDGQTFILADDGSDNVVSLTHGTDTVPVLNYVYCIISGSKSILQASTTKPSVSGVGLYANVVKYLVPSAIEVQSNGFYSSHQIIDRFGSNDQSHIRHINDVLRERAQWISGITQTITRNINGGSLDDIFISLTSGVVRQLHQHVWSTYNNGDDLYIINGATTPYELVANINQIDEGATGINLHTNNRRFSVVFGGTQDQDGTDRKLYALVPTGDYGNDADAISDIDKTSVFTPPVEFSGTWFLIARLVLKYTNASGGTLEIVQINGADFEDLRTASVTGGGGNITQNEFSDANHEIFNATDPTKILKQDLDLISAGTTRTLKPPNVDGTYITTGNLSDITSVGTLDALDISGTLGSVGSVTAFTGTSGQGAYLGWNRGGSSGATTFANQLGLGAGGWDWLSYDADDILTDVAFTISASGNAVLKGTFTAQELKASVTSGDPKVVYSISGTTDFSGGLDDTDGDSFKEQFSTTVGTTTTRIVTTAGEQTMPLQPAFFAADTGGVTDVTGDGTPYNIIFGTEAFDRNLDYNSTTGIFTASVTGRYSFHAAVTVSDLTSSHTNGFIFIITSNRNAIGTFGNPYAMSTAGFFAFQVSTGVIDMDAGDTAFVQLTISGGGKDVDIPTSVANTHFSGHLAC